MTEVELKRRALERWENEGGTSGSSTDVESPWPASPPEPERKTSPVAIEAQGLVRRYGDMAAGESVSLVGASGCGKTTLLHVLDAVDFPEQGQGLTSYL